MMEEQDDTQRLTYLVEWFEWFLSERDKCVAARRRRAKSGECVRSWGDMASTWGWRELWAVAENWWTVLGYGVVRAWKLTFTYEIAAPTTNLTQIISRVYPERKWIKERMHHTEKPKLNRVKQIRMLARSITKRKPDIRGSGEKETVRQLKIHRTDWGFSSIKWF
jgi:hypothetical protein